MSFTNVKVLRIIPVGNEAKLFFDRYKDVASQLKTQDYLNLFSLLLKRMGTILKTINSNLRIKLDAFRIYCQVTTDLITSHLKFVRISPTLHQVRLRYYIETIGVFSWLDNIHCSIVCTTDSALECLKLNYVAVISFQI